MAGLKFKPRLSALRELVHVAWVLVGATIGKGFTVIVATAVFVVLTLWEFNPLIKSV